MHELGQPHAGGLGCEGRKAAGKGAGGVQDGAHLPHGARVAALRAVGAQVLALPDAGEGGVPAGLGHDVLHGLGHKRLLVGVHHHGEVRVKAQVKGIAVQDARAHAVDGHDPGVVHGKGRLGHAGAAQRGPHALADLSRGRLGEGDDEDLREVFQEGAAVRAGAGREGPGHALGEREGLARAGARLHEEGLVERPRDSRLALVQAREVDAGSGSRSGWEGLGPAGLGLV